MFSCLHMIYNSSVCFHILFAKSFVSPVESMLVLPIHMILDVPALRWMRDEMIHGEWQITEFEWCANTSLKNCWSLSEPTNHFIVDRPVDHRCSLPGPSLHGCFANTYIWDATAMNDTMGAYGLWMIQWVRSLRCTSEDVVAGPELLYHSTEWLGT